MDTIYDAKILIVDDNANCWHCCASNCGVQATAT